MLWLDLLLVPAVLVGGVLGRLIAGRLSQRTFETVVLVLTGATALWLLVGPA